VTVALAACACGGRDEPAQNSRTDVTVIAIDRTGVTGNGTWSVDVASQVMAEVERGLDDGIESVELIGIGSTPKDTERWATIDLTHIEGNTQAKRNAVRDGLVTAAGAAARQVAEQPVTTYGTDVVAALTEAAALCNTPTVRRCWILLATDLEDQRVTNAPSAAAAVEELRPLMPDLEGIPLSVTGLGASGANSSLVDKVAEAWDALLREAGATDVRIARSL
jgi:hypothetical protein